MFSRWIAVCLLVAVNGSAQDTIVRSNNAIYLELVGQAPVVSVDYERLLWQNERMYISGKVGVGLLSGAAGFFVNVGRRYDYFETGLNCGVMDIGNFFKSDYEMFVSPSAGYKRLSKSGFFFKAYACPLFFPKCYLERNTYGSSGGPFYVSGLSCK